GAPDQALVQVPERGRPHESLVVEPGRKERREHVARLAEIEPQRWPAVLAARRESREDLDLRGAHIGLGARPGAELDQGVRLLGTGAEDAARPMILEAAPDQVDAVGEQGRGQGVTGKAGVAPAVEGEADRPGAIDPAAARVAARAHEPASRLARPAISGGCSPMR